MRFFQYTSALVLVSACGGGATGVVGDSGSTASGRADGGRDATHSMDGAGGDGGGSRETGRPDVGHADVRVDATSPPDVGVDSKRAADAGCSGGCPADYKCGTANGLPVCRAASGIPLFSNVFVILEENTSLSTLVASINANAAPNFASLRTKYASGTGYHGVSHPSLPNYIALTSGSTQGIGCDCHAQSGQGTCNFYNCTLITGGCTCTQSVKNLADQIEAANKTWGAFGESMGTACNVVDGTNYAVRHVPFLYYDDVQTNTARCMSHVVDYSLFKVASPPDFTYIAPNLIDDMHNPLPATQKNITDGDTWIGPVVTQITGSAAYKEGGLFVIVWDEDDGSGGITGSNDPIPIFVLSPYAKSGGYMSTLTMDHYSLLATIEDGMGLPRLGKAGMSRPSTADTLADYFPAE